MIHVSNIFLSGLLRVSFYSDIYCSPGFIRAGEGKPKSFLLDRRAERRISKGSVDSQLPRKTCLRFAAELFLLRDHLKFRSL